MGALVNFRLSPKTIIFLFALFTFIASFSSFVGFISHLFKSNLKLSITVLIVISVILDSQLVSRFIAVKLKSEVVRKFFGLVLLGVAALLIIKDVI